MHAWGFVAQSCVHVAGLELGRKFAEWAPVVVWHVLKVGFASEVGHCVIT